MTSSFSSPPGKLTRIELWKSGVGFIGSFLILCPGKFKSPCNLKHNGWTERKSRLLWKYDQLEPRSCKFSLVTRIQELFVSKYSLMHCRSCGKNLIEATSLTEKEYKLMQFASLSPNSIHWLEKVVVWKCSLASKMWWIKWQYLCIHFGGVWKDKKFQAWQTNVVLKHSPFL